VSKPRLFELVIPCDSDADATDYFANALAQCGLRAVDAPVIAWQPRLFSTQQDAVVRAHVQSL
jgi:3-hydroxyisobutyrate dehydrogenase-like beta-hydroxyacid dehydrogenase